METITLDDLISTYGRPFYIKIDVEGYEAKVLKGLRTAVPYLSFEVNLPDFRSEGEQCIARLREIAADGLFNCAVGDRLIFSKWMSHDAFAKAFAEIRETSVDVFWQARSTKVISLRLTAEPKELEDLFWNRTSDGLDLMVFVEQKSSPIHCRRGIIACANKHSQDGADR